MKEELTYEKRISYTQVLEVLNNMEICINSINIITKTEENKLLKTFNDTAVKYDKNKLLNAL